MTWSGRKIAGLGCGVLVVGAVAVAGALTWYSTRIGGQYKQVQRSEQVLIEATAVPTPFTAPSDGVPLPARLEAFAGVRAAMAEWRTRLATEDRRFAAGQGRWWRRADAANDLVQVLAGFWLARNEALTGAAMSPDEYVWLYGLVYYGWLDHDPAVGRQPGSAPGVGVAGTDDSRFAKWRRQWQDGVAVAAAAQLEPLRDRLVAGWTEETNPVELIFIADTEKKEPTGAAADDK